MTDAAGALHDLTARLLDGEDTGEWDRAGRVPDGVIRTLASAGVLSPSLPRKAGGPGLSSLEAGELTAAVGRRCSSLRSLMTSHGMAAWSIRRLGDRGQRDRFLPDLVSGRLAAVAFSEPDAGSDLSAMACRIRRVGDRVVVDGRKVWTTGAAYADHVVVFGRNADGAGAVVVPVETAGVTIDRIADPLGCRAAGHADVVLDEVSLPADHLLAGSGGPVTTLATHALAWGRISVAWGCVGILRACLDEVTLHVRTRRQFGVPLADHQLVAAHVAELATAERTATLACRQASRCWDDGSPEMVVDIVRAKYVASRAAVDGAGRAVQLLASAGVRDGHPVARAHRDAKLMELIEGSSEICQLVLAEHVLGERGPRRWT